METALIFGALGLLLLVRVPVAVALAGLGILLMFQNGLPLTGLPQRIAGTLDSYELLALPLFLLMANVLLKGGVGKDLYGAVRSWVGHWPGGLGIATILSCGMFSAICGSSVAAAATIGSVALPEMVQRGYERSVVLGWLAAGGTLGILFPPSIPLIVFGLITEESVSALYLAGIGPGIFLTIAFVIYNMINERRSPVRQATPKASRAERISASMLALPTLALAATIAGTLYFGVMTPSEASGLGLVWALLITFGSGRMDRTKLFESLESALKATVLIFLIILSAKIFSDAISLYQIPQQVGNWFSHSISMPGLFVFMIGSLSLAIGLFLEPLSLLLILVPVVSPSLQAMNVNPIWFGIFLVLLIETALIIPPLGLNLFVIQAVGNARMDEIVKGAAPVALIMLATAVLLWFWPELVLAVLTRVS